MTTWGVMQLSSSSLLCDVIILRPFSMCYTFGQPELGARMRFSDVSRNAARMYLYTKVIGGAEHASSLMQRRINVSQLTSQTRSWDRKSQYWRHGSAHRANPIGISSPHDTVYQLPPVLCTSRTWPAVRPWYARAVALHVACADSGGNPIQRTRSTGWVLPHAKRLSLQLVFIV